MIILFCQECECSYAVYIHTLNVLYMHCDGRALDWLSIGRTWTANSMSDMYTANISLNTSYINYSIIYIFYMYSIALRIISVSDNNTQDCSWGVWVSTAKWVNPRSKLMAVDKKCEWLIKQADEYHTLVVVSQALHNTPDQSSKVQHHNQNTLDPHTSNSENNNEQICNEW